MVNRREGSMQESRKKSREQWQETGGWEAGSSTFARVAVKGDLGWRKLEERG